MRTTAAFAAALLLVGSMAGVHAQEVRAAGRVDQSSASGTKSDSIGIDREAAVCHALCMAIEGSELSCCAQQCSKPGGERGTAGGGTALAMAIEQHARDAFQASMHLFDSLQTDQAATASPASANCEAFYQAAKRYSQALESCCRNTGDNPPSGRANLAPAKASQDPAQMTLLNHAVKEAVQGVALRKMIRHHQDRSETASTLDEHAKHMIESSDEALRSVPGARLSRRATARIGTATANLPKRDSAVETASRRAEGAVGQSNEDLASLAVALIDAVKRLAR